MKIVGLGHYSRTGKDTFANYLVDYLHEYNPTLRVKKIPFAWKLKQICHDLYGWDGLREPEFYDIKENEYLRDVPLPTIGKTPVQIWVAFGTPAVREQVYDKTWIDYLLQTDQGLDVLIVPDVRFPNEVSAIEQLGGSLHKIVRPGYGPRKTVADRALVGYTGWHYVWGGNGLMSGLRHSAFEVCQWLTRDVSPVQSAEERAAALAVEVIEPWDQTPTTPKLRIEIDEALALKICQAGAVGDHEGLNTIEDLVFQIKAFYPQLAGRNLFREMLDAA